MRPRLVAISLLVLLAACGADVRCGAPGAPKVRVVEIGGSIGCTVTLGDATQKVTAEVKDLKGTVVVRG